MKRLAGLWDQLAYQKARKGKRSRNEVAWFGLELEICASPVRP